MTQSSRNESSLALHKTKSGRGSPAGSVSGIGAILAFVVLSACGQTGLSGSKQATKAPPATDGVAAGKVDKKAAAAGQIGADSASVFKGAAGSPVVQVPAGSIADAATPGDSAKSNLPTVEIVLEVVRYRLGNVRNYNQGGSYRDDFLENLFRRSGVLGNGEWRSAHSAKTPITSNEMLNKNRNCLALSISDGPDVDFGCDRSPDFKPLDFDADGKIKVRKTVRVLQKNYCNKVSIKATTQEPNEINSFTGVSTPGKISNIDTKNVDTVRANKQWKFSLINGSYNGVRYEQADDGTKIYLYTSGIPMENQPGETGDQAMERLERNTVQFDIQSDNMMNFSIENNGGCKDKALLLPM